MIAWIDGSAGASGDMLLGALVGAGVPVEVLRDGLARLELGMTLRVRSVDRGGLAATKVDVVDASGAPVGPDTHHRGLDDVREVLSALEDTTRRGAEAVFERLARAEAAVHGVDVGDVHFHEVGALDAIADVVGVVTGFAHLAETMDDPGADLAVSCSTLHLGSGRARSAHGPLPVPAPAVLAVLTGVAPVAAGPAPFESTTPTGAALLAELVDDWGPMPAMTVRAVGVGAGGRDPEGLVNAVRLVVGDPA